LVTLGLVGISTFNL